MSHFSTVTTKLTNRECLVQALQNLQLTVHVYEKPQSLRGYYSGEHPNLARRSKKGKIIRDDTSRIKAGLYECCP